MKATWREIESVLDNGNIESLDRAILESFAKVERIESQNVALLNRFDQARNRIMAALAKLDAAEKERADREQASATLHTLDSEKTVKLLSAIEYELRRLREEAEAAAKLQQKQLHWTRVAGVTIWIAYVLFVLFGVKVYLAR